MMASFLSVSPHLVVCRIPFPGHFGLENLDDRREPSKRTHLCSSRLGGNGAALMITLCLITGMASGLNLALRLLTRRKHQCMAVKNLLTGRVDNCSWLTLRWPLACALKQWTRSTRGTLGTFGAGGPFSAGGMRWQRGETRVSPRSRASRVLKPGFHSAEERGSGGRWNLRGGVGSAGFGSTCR